MSSPRLMRSASSALRATVTLTLTSTSGCTAMLIVCLPMVLIGASSSTWLRLMMTPSASKEEMMSRTLTEPNSWPVSEAWRSKTTLRPLIFSATLAASPLALRLLASSSAFMPSNLARLSAVARSALPRGSRKLRAKPSLTRTTSPIWPSLATRSSKITSMVSLLSDSVDGIGRRHPLRELRPEAEELLGDAEQRDGECGQRRERQHEQQREINGDEPQRPAAHALGDAVNDGEAE